MVEKIIELLEKGEKVQDIAKACNKNVMTIYHWKWAIRVPEDIRKIVRENIFMSSKQMQKIKELRGIPLSTLNRVRSLERKKLVKEAEK